VCFCSTNRRDTDSSLQVEHVRYPGSIVQMYWYTACIFIECLLYVSHYVRSKLSSMTSRCTAQHMLSLFVGDIWTVWTVMMKAASYTTTSRFPYWARDWCQYCDLWRQHKETVKSKRCVFILTIVSASATCSRYMALYTEWCSLVCASASAGLNVVITPGSSDQVWNVFNAPNVYLLNVIRKILRI